MIKRGNAMKTNGILTIASLVLLFLASVAGVAPAQDQLTASQVPDAELATSRGGYLGQDGLLVSFGIERAVYVNGVLSASSSLNFSSAGALKSGAPGTTLVQIGPDGSNLFRAAQGTGALPGGLTVIQNTLDRQVISNHLAINAQLANMSIFRDISLQSALRQQMINAVR